MKFRLLAGYRIHTLLFRIVMQRTPRTLVLFYALVLYIFLQFCWWAYLIINLNMDLFSLREATGQLTDASSPLRNKLLMVVGEGTVFLVLLFIGFVQVKRSFLREVAVAKQQRNFLLSVTHELNSPLASVKLYLQTLQKRSLEPEKRQQMIQHALYEVDRQHKLIENILHATRADDSSYQLLLEEIDLTELVERIAENHRSYETHEIRVSTEPVTFTTDRTALESMVNNLLENARKYSPEGEPIDLRVTRSNDHALLEVCDRGPGVPTEERKRIFQKFYRIGSEDTRRSKGTGLGLYLVRFFAHALGGTITVHDNDPKGTCFRLELPVSMQIQKS